MNNKYYSCPFCQQTSSRKWNLQVHLIRKHHGVGSPLENNWDERSSGAHNKYSSKRILPFTERQKNIGKTSPASYILKGLHEFLEIESLLDKLIPREGPQPLQMPMYASNSFPTFEEFLDILTSLSFTPKTDPLRQHIMGYECYICSRCLVTSPLSFIVIKDTGKVFRTEHRCHPVAIARVEKLTENEKNRTFLYQYISSNDTMSRAIKNEWIDGKSPYLIAKKLQSVPRNSYDFTSELEHGSEWLNRVTRDEIILLDDEQLAKFLFLSNGNSYVTFHIWQADLQVCQSYFATLSKEPSLPFDSIIENPEIFPFNPPLNVCLSPDQTLIQLEKEN
jgi:hypothetical protein